MCSTRKATFAMGGQGVWCEEREPAVLGGSDLEQIDRVFNLRRECAVSKGLHLAWVHRVCGVVRKCAVSGGSYLYYEERMCSTRRGGV